MSRPVDVGPWRWAVMQSDLGRSAFAVAMVLGVRMDADGTIPARYAVGVRRIAADARMHKDTAAAAVAELVEAGWLLPTRAPKGRRPGQYRAALPAGVVSGSEGQNPDALRPGPRDATPDDVAPLRPGSGALRPDSGVVVSGSEGHHQHYQQETSSSTAAVGHVVAQAAAAGIILNGRHRVLVDGALGRGWTAGHIAAELVPRITAAGVTSPAALAVTVLRELGPPPAPPPPRVDDCPDCEGRGTILPEDGEPMQCSHPRLAA